MLLDGALTRARPGGHAADEPRHQPPSRFSRVTGITGIVLSVVGVVPGIDEATFVAAAEGAKANCPVSKALAGTTITLEARLG